MFSYDYNNQSHSSSIGANQLQTSIAPPIQSETNPYINIIQSHSSIANPVQSQSRTTNHNKSESSIYMTAVSLPESRPLYTVCTSDDNPIRFNKNPNLIKKQEII